MGMLIWLELVLGAFIVRQTMPFKWTFKEKSLYLASYAYVYGCKYVKVRSIVGMNMHSREKLYNTILPIKVENHPNYTPGNQTSPLRFLERSLRQWPGPLSLFAPMVLLSLLTVLSSCPTVLFEQSYFATVKIPVYFCFILEYDTRSLEMPGLQSITIKREETPAQGVS